MKTNEVVPALAALAQESRLALFRLLVKRGPEGYSPGQLSEKLDIPGPTLSFHLSQLKHAGLTQCRREGRSLIYSANFEAMNALLGLKENWLTSLSIYPPFASKGASWICIPFKMTKNKASCSIKKIAMGGSAARTTGIVGRNTVPKKKH